MPEESFLRKRKRSENANRRNTAQQGKSSSQIPLLLSITEEIPDTEDRIDAIFSRHPVGAGKDKEKPFFPKWSLKNKSRLIYSSASREVAGTIYPPTDVEFVSQCSWDELFDMGATSSCFVRHKIYFF